MVSIETVRMSSELVRPLLRRLLPPAAENVMQRSGSAVARACAVAQSRLPEPIVICLKMLLAWVLLPLLVVAFFLTPALGKFFVAALVGASAKRKMEQSRAGNEQGPLRLPVSGRHHEQGGAEENGERGKPITASRNVPERSEGRPRNRNNAPRIRGESFHDIERSPLRPMGRMANAHVSVTRVQ